MAVLDGKNPTLASYPGEQIASKTLYPALCSISPTDHMSITPLQPVPYAAAKRGLDILLALLLLIAAAPLMALIAALVKLTSRGPAIFKQTRIGLGGKPFTCYKFRSMCADAESRRQHLLHLNEVSGPVFKIKNDPRVTPIGRILRKYSLDELPQLFNVLQGDMSLVGPRPPVAQEVAQYGERERRRLAVKPGLTCLWQVNGRSHIAFDRWVELDLLYIETMSFWGDIKILLQTIPAVLTGRGAH
ncbi:MAG TPA: exopolysaccharide biosynthesis polyprenyl glycosylphosphotransferase [Chthonomonadaceae bacterium]|nr:exopolysaccharide biosynthesis polyprenyl glycosylphosphotransferase [Chthonomonadaceae bacterium]